MRAQHSLRLGGSVLLTLSLLGPAPPCAQEDGSRPLSGGLRVECDEAELSEALSRLASWDPNEAIAAVTWLADSPWPAWGERGPDGWGSERPWRRWLDLLRAEAGTRDESSPRRRSELALVALLQDRPVDAWRELLAAGPSPEAAAVLPAFLPGIPVEALGTEDPLPAGVRLTPSLPPPRGLVGEPPPEGTQLEGLAPFRGRSMKLHELFVAGNRVAGTWLDLAVRVDADGVQVDLLHRRGPSVQVSVHAPLPPSCTITRLYVDWEDLADAPPEASFTVSAAEPEHTLWTRLSYRRDPWPRGLSQLERPGPDGPDGRARTLLLVAPPDVLAQPFLQRLAETLEEALERPVELADPLAAARLASDLVPAPRTIHLGRGDGGPGAFDPDQFERDLARLLSRVEARVLSSTGPSAR